MEAAVAIQNEDVGAEERRGHCCSENSENAENLRFESIHLGI